MKKILFTLAFLSIIASQEAEAQVYGNSQYNQTQNQNINVNRNAVTNAQIVSNNEVVLSINGLMNITADNYVAMFNVTQLGETIEITNQMMNERISRFITQLKTLGIDTNNIRIDMISSVPKYEYQVENKVFSKTLNEVPIGFEMQKNVTIRYKNSGQLDDIITAAARAEVYDLVKVDYFIPDIQKSYDALREKCLQALKTRTKSYEILGIKLDTTRKVFAEDYFIAYPQTRYGSYQAFSQNSYSKGISTGKLKFHEMQKSTSRYYSQVDYDNYDVVVNPVVLEPVVQLSYTLTVKYFTKEEPMPKNQYYIITPTGDAKQFNPR